MSRTIYKWIVGVLIIMLAASITMPLSKVSAQGEKIVHITVAEELSSLNPLVGNSLVDWFVYNLIYDKLAIYDTELNPKPWLAENWTLGADKVTWTLHLVHNATWQDGKPFTAHDVVFTFNYLKKHTELWMWLDELQYVANVTAPDDYTVVIKTTKPVVVLDRYVFPRLPIVPKHIWENISNPATFPNSNPVGNGPFILEEYKPGEYLKFKANPNYWKGKVHIDGIIAKIGLTPDEAFLELKTGKLDILVLSAEYIKEAEKDPNIKVVISDDIYFDYLTLNTKKYPLNITEFRRALSYAIDKQDLVNRILLGYGEPLYSVIPPTYKLWYYPNVTKYEYNPDKARSILDSLGFRDTDGDGIRELPNGQDLQLEILTLSTWPPYVRMADLLTKYLRDVGISAKTVAVEWGEESSRLHNRNYEIAIWGYTVAPDPSQFLSQFLSTAQPWWSMGEWGNATYDELYAQQLEEFDLAKRQQMIWKMQDILAQELPIIPIWMAYVAEGYRIDTYTGWIPMPMGILGIYNKLTWLSVRPAEQTTTVTTEVTEVTTVTSEVTEVTTVTSVITTSTTSVVTTPITKTITVSGTPTTTVLTTSYTTTMPVTKTLTSEKTVVHTTTVEKPVTVTSTTEKTVVPGWVYGLVAVLIILVAGLAFYATRRR